MVGPSRVNITRMVMVIYMVTWDPVSRLIEIKKPDNNHPVMYNIFYIEGVGIVHIVDDPRVSDDVTCKAISNNHDGYPIIPICCRFKGHEGDCVSVSVSNRIIAVFNVLDMI